MTIHASQTLYVLSESAKKVTWKDWMAMGGCGLSGWAIHYCLKQDPVTGKVMPPMARWTREGITLGDIAAASVLASRELARFAVEHLNRPEWAVEERPEDRAAGSVELSLAPVRAV